MNRFRAYFPADESPVADGDGAFLGVNMRLDPAQLPTGIAAGAINKRFSDGVAETRKGNRILPWGAQGFQGYGPDIIVPYGAIAGGGVFNDPLSGESWLIVAARNGVFRCRPGSSGANMPLPAGETIPARVQLLQTYNGMVMLRGPDQEPLYCDDIDLGWQALPEAANAVGNVAIPAGSNGIYFQNRLFVIDGRTDATHVDTIFVSDFGAVFDVLEGSLAYNSFKINQGSSDRLIAVYRFNDTTLIAAKADSIYVVANVYGDNPTLASNARLDAVTTEYGCRAARSFVQVGSDVWFLAHQRGVCSIRQTETNALQGVDIPVSRDIESLVKRINWQYAANATAAYWDNKVYFAVPLDNATRYGTDLSGSGNYAATTTTHVTGLVAGATYHWAPGASESALRNGTETILSEVDFTAQGGGVTITHTSAAAKTFTLQRIWRGYNNAILVYDTLNQQWAGHDEGDAVMVREFVKFSYGGVIRLGFFSDDGFLRLVEDGPHDHLGDEDGEISYVPISDSLTTRGYHGSTAGQKKFIEARLNLGTWWPRFTVSATVDGVRESRTLAANVTKSPVAYYRPHGQADWVPSNAGDDFDTPFREDYALLVPQGGMIAGDSGINASVIQEAEETHRLRENGRYVQLTIASTRGRCVVQGVKVESIRGRARQITNA